MIHDNAIIEHASDIVADNVTVLAQGLPVNSLVYLTQQDGANAPGLYIYSELQTWVFLMNSAAVE